MKNFYASGLFLLAVFFFNTSYTQYLENFEDETPGDTVFTSGGQDFYISNELLETYNVFSDGFEDFGSVDDCVNCGWNGTGADAKFIDNSGHDDGNQNGSSFSLNTVGGVGFGVHSLYLFCSTTLATPTSGTLTIQGKLQGNVEYTITKSSGFGDVTNLTPYNGFTFIDFATEGTSDFTQIEIDELVFESSGNLDYMALDAFSWIPAAQLSLKDVSLKEVSIYPNPSNEIIHVSGVQANSKYLITNSLGAEMANGKFESNSDINVSALDQGVYFLKTESGQVVRFVKN